MSKHFILVFHPRLHLPASVTLTQKIQEKCIKIILFFLPSQLLIVSALLLFMCVCFYLCRPV